MHKKRITILISTFAILVLIAGILFTKNCWHNSIVARIQIVNINSKSKKISNYDVLSNRKIREIHDSHDFSIAEKIKVDPNIFGTYTKKNQTHLKLLKKIPLYNQEQRRVNDANYWKMINSIVQNVHSDIYKLTLFRVHKHYYAYVHINQ